MSIINKLQDDILHSFSSIEGSDDFYFIGGTALSLFYLKHRRSEDLDFFTVEQGLVPVFSLWREEIIKQLP